MRLFSSFPAAHENAWTPSLTERAYAFKEAFEIPVNQDLNNPKTWLNMIQLLKRNYLQTHSKKHLRSQLIKDLNNPKTWLNMIQLLERIQL